MSIYFGDHTLHHLFPTVDHSKLPLLYGVFHETCEQFHIPYRLMSQKELIWGKFAQLARIEPNENPSGYKEDNKDK